MKESKKIMVLTSNSRGGIAQFAFFLAKEMNRNENVDDVVLMVPRDSEYSVSGTVHIEFYDKISTLKPDLKKFEDIISKVDKHDPTHIIFSEISVSNLQLASYIRDNYRISVVLHDALKRPGFSLKDYFKERYFQRIMGINIRLFEKIVVLSSGVLDELNERYEINQKKIVKMKLCSHLHVTEEVQYGNMIGEDYFLFFGRIQKYKGLETLFEAYAKDRNKILPKLVIAGKGEFTKKEKELFEQIKDNVILMKKYITDETLASLLNYTKAAILPYVEATQSGLIPMAYQFGKPVVVSDLSGLSENVLEGVTGYVFPVKNSTELYTILKKLAISKDEVEHLESATKAFYADNYNWSEHVNHLIEEL